MPSARLRIYRATPSWELPPEARDLVLNTLRDPGADLEDRLIAAELAGDMVLMDDAIAEALLATVRDGGTPEVVRAQAALSLGPALEDASTEGFDELGDAAITEETFGAVTEGLRRLYVDAAVPESVRRRILEASVRAPQPWHADAVRAAWVAEDPDWKTTAVFAMGWSRGFGEAILDALESDDEALRFEAVRAAGRAEVQEAWPHVKRLLSPPAEDRAMLIAAIECVPTLRPEEAEELLGPLLDHEDDDVAAAAEEALAMSQNLA